MSAVLVGLEAAPVTDTSPSSQSLTETGLQVQQAQVPISAGTWALEDFSNCKEYEYFGAFVGNYPYW